MKNLKKSIHSLVLGLALTSVMAGSVFAATVYYKGTPVNWEHGRKLGVMSFSEVQTHKFEHSATTNSTFSGWKEKGVVAYAQQFVGGRKAVAYWDCR